MNKATATTPSDAFLSAWKWSQIIAHSNPTAGIVSHGREAEIVGYGVAHEKNEEAAKDRNRHPKRAPGKPIIDLKLSHERSP